MTNSPTSTEQVIEHELDKLCGVGEWTDDHRAAVEIGVKLSRNTPADSEVERFAYFGTPLSEMLMLCREAPGELGNEEIEHLADTIETLLCERAKPVDDAPGVNCPDCGGRIPSACPHCGTEPIDIAPVDGVAELVERLRADDDLSARIQAADMLLTLSRTEPMVTDAMIEAGRKAAGPGHRYADFRGVFLAMQSAREKEKG